MSDFVTVLFDDASNPSKVTVGLLMAMNAAKKGQSVTVVLMVAAARLAVPGALDGIDVGAPFKPAKELLEATIAAGGKIMACGSCLEYNKISRDHIDPRFGVVNAGEVVDLLTNAKGTFQVT